MTDREVGFLTFFLQVAYRSRVSRDLYSSVPVNRRTDYYNNICTTLLLAKRHRIKKLIQQQTARDLHTNKCLYPNFINVCGFHVIL